MHSYSQNREDLFVLDYFKGFKGTLLEIGANDGRTLSNSLLLIENGWKAHLVEPSSVYNDICALHGDNPRVTVYNFGIGAYDEVLELHESGCHVPNGADKALVSTFNTSEMSRWPGVEFKSKPVQLVSWETFAGNRQTFDFISIDAEGYDWEILQQIDLTLTSCLIIEWNSIEALKVTFIDYCASYGLKLAHVNAENLIFTR